MSFPAMPKSVANFYRGSLAADPVQWASGFADDALFYDPVGSEPLKGRATIEAHIASFLPNFDPFGGLQPTEAHTVGNNVAVSWTGAALSTSGNPVNWSGISVFELDESGAIATATVFFNQSVFVAQLNG